MKKFEDVKVCKLMKFGEVFHFWIKHREKFDKLTSTKMAVLTFTR